MHRRPLYLTTSRTMKTIKKVCRKRRSDSYSKFLNLHILTGV
uniref:Uncharacterized protein n=1 Tax=Rhizophora mucronata TaxID=61149 RepID=A0A2P2QD73_RHIMU